MNEDLLTFCFKKPDVSLLFAARMVVPSYDSITLVIEITDGKKRTYHFVLA